MIKDVILSDQDSEVEVPITYTGPVSAILINVNDHGYCKIRFDDKSLNAFVNNLNVRTISLYKNMTYRK